MDHQRGPLPLAYTLVLAVILVAATGFGLLVDDAYRVSPGVRSDLPAVLRGQDALTLASVPVLVWAAVGARRGSFLLHLLGLGLLLYYAYSYVMYAFSPFSDAFPLYLMIIGLGGYGFVDGLFRLDVHGTAPAFARLGRRALGVFLIAVATLFIVMWLAMILPAIPGGLPEGRVTYDIASPVHVLDLSFVLPLVAATGIMLLRGHVAGPVLAVVLLFKMLTLGLALLAMNLLFVEEGTAGEVPTWGLIVVVSGAWIAYVARRTDVPAGPWMRPSLW